MRSSRCRRRIEQKPHRPADLPAACPGGTPEEPVHPGVPLLGLRTALFLLLRSQEFVHKKSLRTFPLNFQPEVDAPLSEMYGAEGAGGSIPESTDSRSKRQVSIAGFFP